MAHLPIRAFAISAMVVCGLMMAGGAIASADSGTGIAMTDVDHELTSIHEASPGPVDTPAADNASAAGNASAAANASAANNASANANPAANASEQRGPHVDLPDHVPDHVSEIHASVRAFLTGSLEERLGGVVSAIAADAVPGNASVVDENASVTEENLSVTEENSSATDENSSVTDDEEDASDGDV